MGLYQGDYLEDATVYIPLNTFTSDDPSASSTITNFANTDIHIHKDDSLTPRNNAAGITVSIDFDGITGGHMIKIDTNDDTVVGFWVTGADYFVRMEGTTIDGATVNAWIGHFSIENRFKEVDVTHILGHLLTNTGTQIADAFETMFDVASPTLLASTVMRGTDNANTTVPDAAGTAATPAEVATVLTNYGGPTKTEMDNAHALLATLTKLLAYVRLLARSDAAVETDAATELTAINADEGAGGGDFSSQTDSEEAIRDRGDAAWTGGGSAPTAAEVADAIWDEVDTDHNTVNTFGGNLQKIAGEGVDYPNK